MGVRRAGPKGTRVGDSPVPSLPIALSRVSPVLHVSNTVVLALMMKEWMSQPQGLQSRRAVQYLGVRALAVQWSGALEA